MASGARKKTRSRRGRVSNEERRRASTDAVLAAALELFVTQGYGATTTEDIARQAGLTKGAVYFYFKDKLSLLLDLLSKSEDELLNPIFERMNEDGLDATEQIVLLTNWLAQIGAERKEIPLLHVLMSLEFSGQSNPVTERIEGIYKRLHGELERVVAQGQASGEFHQDLSARNQAAAIVAMIDGTLLEWHRWGRELDGAYLARASRSLILKGILKR